MYIKLGLLCLVSLAVSILVGIIGYKRESLSTVISGIIIASLISPFVFYSVQKMIEAPNKKKSDETQQRIVSNLDELVANSGNEAILQELIDARTSLLIANSGYTSKNIEKIMDEVPKLAKSYKELRDSEIGAIEARKQKYRLRWEPLINFVISTFDKFYADIFKKGFDFKKIESKKFPIAQYQAIGGVSYNLRRLDAGNTLMELEYISPYIGSKNIRSGAINLRLYNSESQKRIQAIKIVLSPDYLAYFPDLEEKRLNIVDSEIPKEVRDYVVEGMSVGFKNLLAQYLAETDKAD